MSFSNKVYDRLKWVAQYLLPALATLYFALAKLWGLPYAEEVVGTISALDIFLGAMLGISSSNYAGDGTISLLGDGVEGQGSIQLYNGVQTLIDHGRVVLTVKKEGIEE